MFLRIELSSGVPITRQIVNQIRSRCVAGVLQAGDRLPSVRELARELTVNQNTILRVYERLAAEGFLERRHGDGTYVTEFPAERKMELEREKLENGVEALVTHAATLGVAKEELKRRIDAAYKANGSAKAATTKKGTGK